MTDRRYTYFKGEQNQDFAIASMKKYVDQRQELDKFLDPLIAPLIINKKLNILDACCGIGHLIYSLSDLSPKSSFIGIDQTTYLIEEAMKLCKDRRNINFEVADIYDLLNTHPKQFDISINWKTISWLPYYDEIMKVLLGITKSHIFLSSLFYDGDIDFEIKVRTFQHEAGKEGFNAYYNVYSFPRFKEFVLGLGAKNVQSFDFEIGVDIPKPPSDQMGTYTVKLENGRRMQISGAVVMFWKVIRIDL